MSNKSEGTAFENEFASILAEKWFWVHLFQGNRNGQPCDVIAARDGKAYLFDCKQCAEPFFRLSRMEENQYNAMKMFEMMGNLPGMFAIKFPDKTIYLVTYKKIKELQEAGFKRINETVCRTQGATLGEWLAGFDEREEKDGDHHWQ